MKIRLTSSCPDGRIEERLYTVWPQSLSKKSSAGAGPEHIII